MKNICLIVFVLLISKVCICQQTLPGQTIYSSNFNIDDIPRTCLFYIPLNYDKTEDHPLLIMLHDKNNTAKTLIKNYGDAMHALADSVGTVIIYPSAVATTWSDGTTKDSVNDVGYLSILIDYFVQRYQCNADKVYIAGIGNGASMALKTACTIPSKITAVAPLLNNVKPPCENFSLPQLPHEKISATNGKISNASLREMFRFFSASKKE